ncbi:MAG: hypothetical protein Ct9H300mP25_09360 [Acidobacteriota bacterium]|nr:MAG: hypothetical protein Ct9H300mP25_09360 [Acidobacteriota bacterium]
MVGGEKAIDVISADHDCHVVERLDIHNNRNGEGLKSPSFDDVDVAIEFSLPKQLFRMSPSSLHEGSMSSSGQPDGKTMSRL